MSDIKEFMELNANKYYYCFGSQLSSETEQFKGHSTYKNKGKMKFDSLKS